MLLPDLAEKIIAEVRKFLHEDIIVANTSGVIIAGTDPRRIGTLHEGAFITAKNKDKMIITKDDQSRLQGVKAGINLPIFFKGETAGVIGITGDPDKISPFGEIIRKMTELFISESYYAEQLDWQARALEGFMFDWLQSKEWDPSFRERAHLLKINLSINRQVSIAEFKENPLLMHRDLWNRILSWNEASEQDLIIRWGNDRIVLLSGVSISNNDLTSKDKVIRFHRFLESLLSVQVCIGTGKPMSPSNLPDAFRQAERALKIAKDRDKIIFDEDLTMEMIFEDLSAETKIDFIDRTVGSIMTEKDLLLTLQELFKQNHSLKNTAEALHIHINTLHYRLKKIYELSGLNTSDLDDLIKLYLAIRLLEEGTKNS
ncbi:helix-turn-helix domain-containing protein [Bacillus sp. ISL-47]|uniref:CdaR family transcriptional regulator n=1 Tax=Bacillus sp. ISL-47 TaxID=2819130 RepID=UPI001BECD2A8|nr:sugar diacid recognition domain-containing protein [Bacillus sp. ISL-47]MBT2690426.1 helix-turn-helix domain-containing protein [Bacillus sp. ISL-47]MBT2707510.1 helix-turn-helix domain-containing protein [Pseudomonas sp. ISL-84]